MSARNYPYGYGMKKGRIIVNEQERMQILRIFDMRMNGTGVYAIGKKLYEEQIPFFSDSRDKSIKKVSAILYKSVYTGKNGFPAIVEKDVFNRVQEMKPPSFRRSAKAEKFLEREETFEMIYSEEAEEMKKAILSKIKSNDADILRIREMISEFAGIKYQSIRPIGE